MPTRWCSRQRRPLAAGTAARVGAPPSTPRHASPSAAQVATWAGNGGAGRAGRHSQPRGYKGDFKYNGGSGGAPMPAAARRLSGGGGGGSAGTSGAGTTATAGTTTGATAVTGGGPGGNGGNDGDRKCPCIGSRRRRWWWWGELALQGPAGRFGRASPHYLQARQPAAGLRAHHNLVTTVNTPLHVTAATSSPWNTTPTATR